MQVLTSENLFKKYPGKEEELRALLNQLGTLTVLPMVDYMATKEFCNTVTDTDGILIIGNHNVIPYAELNNPASDNDPTVASDAPYACMKDSTYLIPDKIIARIPDESEAATWDYIVTVLNNQITWAKTPTTEVGWFNIVAAVWTPIGQYMHDTFKMNELHLNISPPVTYQTLHPAQYSKKLSYINLHGTLSNGNFYNQIGNTFAVALIPEKGNFEGNLVFTEACYGGNTIGRNKESSIPMMALYSNALGFVASSTIAYGPSSPPVQSADLLASCFFTRILSGQKIGLAFMNAKIDFATKTIQQFGSMNGSARKTLLQFHLFGNPQTMV